eukprot:GEMP01024919.1.p1 GENE.GEMP01024919.1~~GEMP01024919.1.p1  ORF type:complete len:412 (+),score=114.33 GEMP01024919.1:53-1288(+)
MPSKRPTPKSASSAKKVKVEDPVKKNVDIILNAFVSSSEYEFPCRDLLATLIPKVMGLPVEERKHEVQIQTSKMVTDAVHEALDKLQEKEKDLHYKVNNGDQVKADFENKIVTCTKEISAFEEKIIQLVTLESEAKQKLAEDEANLAEESDKIKDHEERYQDYLDCFKLLETTLNNDFVPAVQAPPTDKKEVKKHQDNLHKVFNQFFDYEKALIKAYPDALYKVPEERTATDKLILDQVQKLLQEKMAHYDQKIQDDKPDTTQKDALQAVVDKSTARKNQLTTDLRENRQSKRKSEKLKKEAEAMVKDHPKNIVKWVKDVTNIKSTIETYKDTVVVAHDFLVSRTELPEPVPEIREEVAAPAAPVEEESAHAPPHIPNQDFRNVMEKMDKDEQMAFEQPEAQRTSTLSAEA